MLTLWLVSNGYGPPYGSRFGVNVTRDNGSNAASHPDAFIVILCGTLKRLCPNTASKCNGVSSRSGGGGMASAQHGILAVATAGYTLQMSESKQQLLA